MEAFMSVIQKLYSDLAGVFSLICVLAGAVALVTLLFGRSDKSATSAWSWIKRIVIAWALFNALGAIVSYGDTLLSGMNYQTGGSQSSTSSSPAHGGDGAPF